MTQYSIADARKHLPALVDEVAAGNTVHLSRRGRPVAVVVSVAEYERLKAGRVPFAEAYARFLEKFPEGHGVEPEYWDAIRSKDPGREVNL
jgi:prevent-host-death family protein